MDSETDLFHIERGPSPLASNNPFRNRAADRAISPGVAPRTTATNPFLDVSELGSAEGTTKTGATAGNAKTPSAEQTSDIFVSNSYSTEVPPLTL